MSLTLGIFKIHSSFRLKDVIPLPSIYNLDNFILIENARFHRKWSFSWLVRQAMILSAIFFFLFPLARLAYLWSVWGDPNIIVDRKVEQILINCVISSMAAVMLNTYITLQNHAAELQDVFNQRCKILPRRQITAEELGRVQYLELFIYAFALAFCAFPLIILAGPFMVDYDPLQLIWRQIGIKDSVPEYLVKIFISLEYGFTVAYSAARILSFFLLIIGLFEGLVITSSYLFMPILTFPRCHNHFVMIRIMIQVINNSLGAFFTWLVASGMILASSSFYVAMKMRHEIVLIGVVLMLVIVAVVIVVAIFFTYLADIPNRNGKRYRAFWKGRLKQRWHRMQLASCPEIGFRVGPIRYATCIIGLFITNAVIQCTVNLTLMEGSSLQ